MITLKNIKKVFKTEEIETWALQNVNLEVKKGEFVAIMGPSGCGKSTLLNILGLLDNPSEGTYMLDGKDVSHMSEDDRTDLRKGRLGFVFQSFNLIDELSVVENVELPLLYMGTPKKERRRLVNEVVERVAMSHCAQHFPAQLSGGQQQRISKKELAKAVDSAASAVIRYLMRRFSYRWEKWIDSWREKREKRNAEKSDAEKVTVEAEAEAESKVISATHSETHSLATSADESLPHAAVNRSLVAFDSGQRQFKRSEVKAVEDPSMSKLRSAANEQAYADDVRAFSTFR